MKDKSISKDYYVLFILLQLSFGSVLLAQPKPYTEKYRPQFHFSPEKSSMGDPKGLVYYGGQYHLFWWGHAISEDLVHWKELPYAMKGGDGTFSFFTGSVVKDKQNTAGFGENSMVAIYTIHKRGDTIPEKQGISYSSDGIYYDFYNKNPVLDIGRLNFRDPQVFWHAPTKRWIMVVALSDKHLVHFYASGDLKKWDYLSEFGPLSGAGNKAWECPDIFELPVDGNPNHKKWVFMIGQGPNRVQYFIGSFDGNKFVADETSSDFLVKGTGIPGDLFEGFDQPTFSKWNLSGIAFGKKPSQSDTVFHLRQGYVSSAYAEDTAATGTLTSKVFTIKQSAINFLIGGGNHQGQTCINLIVNGKIVRSSTGSNSKAMKWDGWDVTELKGEQARIEIVDNYTKRDWGYIMVDHILFSKVLYNQRLDHALWIDYGPDFYAAKTWRDVDNTGMQPTLLGWLGNWEYAREVPTSWGRGFESVPRLIKLKTFPEGIRMIQEPVPQLKKIRKDSVVIGKMTINGKMDMPNFKPSINSYEFEVAFDTRSSAEFGMNLLVGNGRKFIIGFNPATNNFYIDRTECSDFTTNATFSKRFPTKSFVPILSESKVLKIHAYVDQSSVELFINDGKTVVSAVSFPAESQTGIELFSTKGNAHMISFKAWQLSSIWNADK